jgi:hypothetical protein
MATGAVDTALVQTPVPAAPLNTHGAQRQVACAVARAQLCDEAPRHPTPTPLFGLGGPENIALNLLGKNFKSGFPSRGAACCNTALGPKLQVDRDIADLVENDVNDPERT